MRGPLTGEKLDDSQRHREDARDHQKHREQTARRDVERFGEHLGELVIAILSYYDTAGKTPERVYHTFVLGLLAQLSHRYQIRSNREAGMGRYDLVMIPKDTNLRGIVMEFKTAGSPEQLSTSLDAALAQMQERRYGAELEAAGVMLRSEIAVAFCGKEVAVRATEFGD